jgi:hypothetical protein
MSLHSFIPCFNTRVFWLAVGMYNFGLLSNARMEKHSIDARRVTWIFDSKSVISTAPRPHLVQVLARLKRAGVEISEEDIVGEFVLTPTEWRDKYGLYRGSSFGLSHRMTQLVALRPANRDPRIKNLFFVGASTSPGKFMSTPTREVCLH